MTQKKASFSLYDVLQDLKSCGIKLINYYEAGPYNDAQIDTKYLLTLKENFIFRKTILVGNDKDELASIMQSIQGFPGYRSLRVETRPSTVSKGQFTLKYISRCSGVEGNEVQIRKAVKKHGGSHTDSEYIVSGAEEKIIGYFSPMDKRTINSYIQLIEAAANRPVNTEELADFQKDLVEYANTLNAAKKVVVVDAIFKETPDGKSAAAVPTSVIKNVEALKAELELKPVEQRAYGYDKVLLQTICGRYGLTDKQQVTLKDLIFLNSGYLTLALLKDHIPIKNCTELLNALVAAEQAAIPTDDREEYSLPHTTKTA